MSLSIGQCLLFTLNQYYYINSYDNNKHQIVHGILFFYIYLIMSIDMLLFILHFIHWQIYIKSNRRLTLLVLLLLYWDHPFFCLYLFSFFLVFGSSLLCFVFALLFFVFRASFLFSICVVFVFESPHCFLLILLFLYSGHFFLKCLYCCFFIRIISLFSVCTFVVFLSGSSHFFFIRNISLIWTLINLYTLNTAMNSGGYISSLNFSFFVWYWTIIVSVENRSIYSCL